MNDPALKGMNGAAIAQMYADRFRSYLAKTPLAKLPRTGAEPNKSLIAAACGFDRRVFRTNPVCRDLLADVVLNLEKAFPDIVAHARENAKEDEATTLAKIDQKYILILAENAALRQSLARYKTLESVMIRSGKLPPAGCVPSIPVPCSIL